MTPHCWLCDWLYCKRPLCQEFLIGVIGNQYGPLIVAVVLYWSLWRFGP